MCWSTGRLDKVLAYNLQLAWRSLFQRRSLTILMIAAVGIGLGILMTVRTMAYQARQLPDGEKSYSLHFLQMDGRGVDGDAFEQWFEGDGITYRDARMLMNADTAARRQTFLWKTDVIVSSENRDVLPKRSRGLVGLSNFFDMFDVPFLYGSAWSEEANYSAEPAAVISKNYNDYFFWRREQRRSQVESGHKYGDGGRCPGRLAYQQALLRYDFRPGRQG